MRRPRLGWLILPTTIMLLPSWHSSVLAQEPDPAPGSPMISGLKEKVGSSVPCAVPLRWRVAEVDSRFGLGREEAEAALKSAFGVWESALGAIMFEVSADGSPVEFFYDERQEASQRRSANRVAAVEAAQGLEAMRARLEKQGEQLRQGNSALGEDAAEHRLRTIRLNDEVVSWTQRGNVPDSVRSRILAERATLEAMGEQLESRRETLNDISARISAETQRFNRLIDEYNRRRRTSDSAAGWQAGEYREEVRTLNGRVDQVRRRIEIYAFHSSRDLVAVLAHELGHALGLGHSDDEGAIMSAVNQLSEGAGPIELRPSDIRMLDAACPVLRDHAP